MCEHVNTRGKCYHHPLNCTWNNETAFCNRGEPPCKTATAECRVGDMYMSQMKGLEVPFDVGQVDPDNTIKVKVDTGAANTDEGTGDDRESAMRPTTKPKIVP
eukprot:gene4568-14919_t